MLRVCRCCACRYAISYWFSIGFSEVGEDEQDFLVLVYCGGRLGLYNETLKRVRRVERRVNRIHIELYRIS